MSLSPTRWQLLRSYATLRRAFQQVSFREYELFDETSTYLISARDIIWNTEMEILEHSEAHVHLSLSAQVYGEHAEMHEISTDFLITPSARPNEADWLAMQELIPVYMAKLDEHESGLADYMQYRLSEGEIAPSEHAILASLAHIEQQYAQYQQKSAFALQLAQSIKLDDSISQLLTLGEHNLVLEDDDELSSCIDALCCIKL